MNPESLKKRAVQGGKWSGLTIAYTTIVNFTVTAILARILSPTEFGLLGMMMVFINIVAHFLDAGVSNAIIYYQKEDKNELSTLYWLNILIGIGFYVILQISTPAIVIYFNEPIIKKYIPWLSITLLIAPLGHQYRILLKKELKFDVLSKIQIVSATFSGILAISIAMIGGGVWSLIIRVVVGTTISTMVYFLIGMKSKWQPKIYFNLKDVGKYLEFGAFQMGERFVTYLYGNVDYLIIGRFLGTEALGLYTLAYSLVTLPITKINPVITNVAFPTFAKIKDDDRLKGVYLKIIKYIATVSFPMLGGMLAVAYLFIPTIYGVKWIPSVTVLEILCVIGMIKSIGNPMGGFLLAKGRVDIGFYLNLTGFIILLFATLIGVKWGIVGIAWSILMGIGLILWPIGFFIRWHIIKMTIWEYFSSIKIPAVSTIVMVAFLLIIRKIVGDITDIINLIVQIALGIIIYCTMSWYIGKEHCLEIKNLLFHNK